MSLDAGALGRAEAAVGEEAGPPLPPAPHAARAAAVAFLATLVVALLLTPPALGIGDPAEFTLVLAVTGVPHPTGYPLYVMLGSAFTRLLHGLGVDWVRAAAAWSAVGLAVAAALLTAAGIRMSTRSGRGAGLGWALPACLFVLHPVALMAATEAEIHTWWYAWCAGAALATLATLRRIAAARPAAAPPAAHEARAPAGLAALRAAAAARGLGGAWFRWGLLAGAGLAHHAASLAFVVPLGAALVVAAAAARVLRPRHAPLALLGALLALASYGFVAWRAFHPAVYQWPLEPEWGSVLAHLRGAAYTFYVGGGWDPAPADRALIVSAILPLLLPGLAAGLWFAFRLRDPRGAWLGALLVAAALLVAFAVSYRVPDPARYFAPAMMVAALAAVPAFAAIERSVSRGIALVLLVAVALSAGAWAARRTADENRRRVRADTRIREAWQRIPFERAIVTWQDDHVNRLKLYQILGGERPGLYVENPNRLTWPGPRRAFHARFGMDPFEGFAARTRDDIARLPDHLRGRTGWPLVDFPEVLEHDPEPER